MVICVFRSCECIIRKYWRDFPVKKALLLLMVLLLAVLLSGCGSKDSSVEPDEGNLFTPLTEVDNSISEIPDEVTATPLPMPQDDMLSDVADDDLSGQIDEPISDLKVDDADFSNFEEPADDGSEQEKGTTEEAESAQNQTGESEEAVEPSPAPVVDIPVKKYQYETYTDEALGYTMKYPSHWIVESGINTVTFTEPVSSGAPMRLAISVKSYDEKLSNAEAKQEFIDYFTTIKDSYVKFAKGKFNNKQAFINRRAWACLYKAKQADGEVVNGYVTMANVTDSNQIVALHFSCSKQDYNKETRAMFKKLMYAVKRIVPSAQ